MYLMLVVILMLFCSTVTSYYWSQFDLVQQTYKLYMQRQKGDLALKALRNYGIGWLNQNIQHIQQILLREEYTITFKRWPIKSIGNSAANNMYQAKLIFTLASEKSEKKDIKLHCKLYANSLYPKSPEEYSCALLLSYNTISGEYTLS